MDTKQVIARFEAERQALAMMDHPNIARVLDAGTTETGRPYFVMELVRGVAITEFCDKNNLSTRERLDLFISVCQAVQHAHQKGIIHRDIKPSNVMVTLHDGQPVVKVIDFGIAKAVNQQLTEKTVFTRYSQMIGTPEYMSPEQAEMSGLDIDTRTDVFSLGVLLYELLTGTTPFDSEYLLSKGYGEMQRIIREEEPIRPSTRISTLGETLTDVAKHRRTSPELLCKLVRSDLDWIVMKTLEKDRSRRYESVSEFAADIKRHLDNEPVLAGRPSTLYRMHKFIKRNRVFVTSVAVVVVVVLLATIVSIVLAFTATKAKEDAEQARNAEQKQKVAFQEEAKRATEAEQREGQLRLVAEEQELAAHRRAYASDMLLCQQALADNNLRRARQLLDRQRPKDGEEDLRGWEWRYLWGCCRGDALLKLDLQGAYFTRAVLTNDDRSVVTFSERGKVSLWDLHTGEDITLQDPRGWMGGSGHLCLSVDGQWIVWHYLNDAEEQTVRIWDTRSHQILAELPIGKVGIRCLALSPDKRTLAVLSPNEGVSLWDIATREKRRHIPLSVAKYMWGNALCYSPNGEVLAFSDNNGKVRLVDAETGEEKNVFSVGFEEGVAVKSLAFSPNGRFLAAGTGFITPSLSIWDTELDMRVTTLIKHTGFVARLAFSPDGQYLASASGDQTIKLWNTKDWSEETTLLGHTDEVWSVEFSRDGKRLVSCGKDGNICLWDTSIPNNSRGSRVLPGEIEHVDVSPDGKTIVGVSSHGQVQLLDAKTFQMKVVPKSLGDNNVAAFWVSADNMLIGSLNPPRVKALDLSTNTLSTFELGLRETEPLYEDAPVFDYFPSCQILSVVYCDPNLERLTIMRWDASTHKELSSCTIDDDVSTIQEVVVSEDAHWAAVSRRSGVEIRDLSTGKKVSDFGTTKGLNQGFALSAGGQLVATAHTGAPIVHIWDIRSQEEVISLNGHNMVIADMEFSPDGQRLATSTIGMEPVKLWDAESWEEICNLDGRPGFSLLWVQFLSDGNTIVGWEGDVATFSINGRLWQAPSWEEIEASESVNSIYR
jgi:WD40 repeat protein